jgi:cytochrome c oxidase assembly protein subunit 15
MADVAQNLKHNILFWYGTTFFLIWMMVMLGGATRLTHSGLSIVEWKPITGIIPPFSFEDWMIEFKKYQTSPEFLKINFSMTLDEFKFIFWMEFCHRFLGRLIGLFFIIPLLALWKSLPAFFKKLSLSILVIGALQGIMGWYMVKSGLVQDPYVSPYRLTVHLSLAFILMGLLVGGFYKVISPSKILHTKHNLLNISFILLVLTILYGGLVAGHKAGLIYNTFPLMGGYFIPSEFLSHTPIWTNFLNNHATIQWLHRVLALLTYFHIVLFTLKTKRMASFIWLGLASFQVILGILTLIFEVPILLGTLHQGIGALLFSWSIWVMFLFKK